MKTSPLITVLAAFVISALSAHAAAPAGWTEDYAKAVEKAKTEKKNILLDFTGSDWCPYCIQMVKEVLSQPKFKAYAKDNLVLVEVDFPNSKPQSKKIKDQNKSLKEKFGAKGFPTFVVVDPEGKELWKSVGYTKGGPDAFIQSISAKTTAKN